jgi:hypothetical protein
VLRNVFQRILRPPSHATVVAYVALFFALSGTAYAAAKFTSADIVDGSLTGADIAADSLTGEDIAPGSIDAGDLSTQVPTGGVTGGTATVRITTDVRWDWGDRDGTSGAPITPEPPGQVFGEIPGVGELFVASCHLSIADREATVGLRNTSPLTLYGARGMGPYLGGDAVQFEALAPGEEAIIGRDLVIVSGDGSDPLVTNLSVTGLIVDDGCRLAASWTQ